MCTKYLLLVLFTTFLSLNVLAIDTSDNITLKAFGVSPQGFDSKELFEPNIDNQGNVTGMVKANFWNHMREEFNALYIHILLYANSSSHPTNPSQFASIPLNQETIRLSDNQLKGLEYLQRVIGFQIIVDTGLSLGPEANSSCDTNTPLWSFAENAANDDFNQIKNLLDAGIEINQFSVDGPFLRIVKGSEKAFSCSTGSTGSIIANDTNAFNNGPAAVIISKYLSRLKNKITNYTSSNNLFSSNANNPLVNVVINLPNIPLDPNGQNYHGFHENVEYDQILQHFAIQPEYPQLNSIVLDYPYSYLLSKNISTNTESGLSSSNINLFNGKLIYLKNQYKHLLRGNPNFTFILNTEGNLAASSNINSSMQYNHEALEHVGNTAGHRRGKYCVVVGSKVRKNSLNMDGDQTNDISHLKLWNENNCYRNLSDWNVCSESSTLQNGQNNCTSTTLASSLDFANHRDSYVNVETNRYYDHSEAYYIRISNNLPNNNGIQPDGLYFASWHDFPRNMYYYGYEVRRILRENRP